uniref:Uncharacterized protein n=1 Tax=Fagus sylvatica TaxID=28930 RepID=A0A2N9H9H9_FAGSY
MLRSERWRPSQETLKQTMFWSLKKVSKELRPGRLFSTFKRKRLDFPMTIIDGVIFKILSVVEGVVLVSTLYFFYLCCGCHI